MLLAEAVVQWGQDPGLTQQFLHKTAAMIEDGPWIFPELNAAGWKYNKQYGIVKIPTETAGGTVVAALGGETWNIGNSGSAQQQSAAWDWIKGAQDPSVMTHITSLMYYLLTKPSVISQYLKGGPEYTVFAKETRRPGHGPRSTAPTTRRCRRRSGPRSSPRSPAPPRSVPR